MIYENDREKKNSLYSVMSFLGGRNRRTRFMCSVWWPK